MSKIKINREQCFYICLISSCFFLYILWAVVMPFNHGPDEYMRYRIPEFIYKYGYLPHGGDERIRDASWGVSYGFTPILSYIISAVFMKITSFFSTAESSLILAARMVSVLSSAGTVFLTVKISKKLFNGIFKYVFVISIAFLPQFVFISSYVNNDAFGIFTVALVIYAMLLAKEKNWNFKSCAFLGISIGLCILSYYNCYGIIVVAGLYAVISVAVDKAIDNKIKFILTRILWVGLFAFIVAGWWFIRNAVIYNGDFFGMRTSGEYSEKYAIEACKPSNRGTPHNLGMSLKELLFETEWIKTSVESFVGNFDSMCLPLEPWNYNIMYAVAIIGAIGSFIPYKLTKMDNRVNNLILRLSCWLMCIITVSLSVYYSYYSDYQPQGRYLLPMLISMNIVMTYGWSSIFNRCNKYVKGFVAFLLIGVYCVNVMYASCFVFIPQYNP